MARNKKLRRLNQQAENANGGPVPTAGDAVAKVTGKVAKAAEKAAPVAPVVAEVVEEKVAPPVAEAVKKKRARFVFVREKKLDVPEVKTPALPTPRGTFAGKLFTKNVKPLPRPEPGRLP